MIAQDNLNRSSTANGTVDREARPKFWIAAYTRPKSEKKAAFELAKAGIETYVPVQKQLRRWSDRTKLIENVVIPMTMFANVSQNQILTLKKHPLIIKLVAYPGSSTPAHIPPEQIESIRKVLSQSESAAEFVKEKFTANDMVMVVRGALKGLTGEVREVDQDTTTVWIAVDLLGGVVVKVKNKELMHWHDDTDIKLDGGGNHYKSIYYIII